LDELVKASAMRWIVVNDESGLPSRLALDAQGRLWLVRSGQSSSQSSSQSNSPSSSPNSGPNSEQSSSQNSHWAMRSETQASLTPDGVTLTCAAGSLRSADVETVAAWFPGLVAEPRRWSAPRVGCTLLLGLLAILIASFALLVPWLGDRLGRMIPQSMEMQLQETMLATLDEQGFSPSTAAQADQERYQALFRRLMAVVGTNQPYQLLFKQHADANAFALPGGVIVFTDPMLALLARSMGGEMGRDSGADLDRKKGDSDADQAFLGVLAHELGHVEQRHAMRQLGRQGALTMAIALFSGNASSVQTLSGALSRNLLGNVYSRDFEREADAFAFAALIKLRISPMVLGRFLQRLSVQQNGATRPELLSTHPVTTERTDAAADAARQANLP